MRLLGSFFLVFTLACFSRATACSCPPIPPFMEAIQSDMVILRVRVVGQYALLPKPNRHTPPQKSDIDAGLPPPPPPPPPSIFASLTTLVVDNVYKGHIAIDTVVFLNGIGASCGASLENWPIGSAFVLKAVQRDLEISDESYVNALEGHTLNAPRPVLNLLPKLHSSICQSWLLPIEDEKVVGYITTRERYEIQQKFLSPIPPSEEERQMLLANLRTTKPQLMTLDAFAELFSSGTSNLK